jgi:hypothetical protein
LRPLSIFPTHQKKQIVMKNQILGFACLFLVVFSTACSKKSDPVASNATACSARSQKVADAGQLWAKDPTNKANCQAYLAALKDFVDNAAACGASATDIAAAQKSIDASICQ